MTALREFIDRESEFMTTTSETITRVLKDGTKRERAFLAEVDHNSKKKPARKCKVCKEDDRKRQMKSCKKLKLCFRCLGDVHHGEACFRSKICGIMGADLTITECFTRAW